MAVCLTTRCFPATSDVKRKSGIPWGCLVKPFAVGDGAAEESKETGGRTLTSVRASAVARCGTCYAYINPFVKWSWNSWRCPLCRTWNSCGRRYRDRNDNDLPELSFSDIEFLVSTTTPYPNAETTTSGLTLRHPIYIFVVDVTGGEKAVETVKKSILQSLDHLPTHAWMALVTVSHKIGVYDMRSASPHVRFTHILPNGTVDPILEECISLSDALTSIHSNKKNILAAIQTIRPDTSDPSQATTSDDGSWWPSTAHISTQMRQQLQRILNLRGNSTHTSGHSLLPLHAEINLDEKKTSPRKETFTSEESGKNGFGSAIHALFSFLEAYRIQDDSKGEGLGFNARIISFLTTRPDRGIGEVQPPKTANDKELNPLSSQFYPNLATALARGGIGVDVYGVGGGRRGLGMEDVSILAGRTGGRVRVYGGRGGGRHETIVEDLTAQFRDIQGHHGLMRLRASPEITIAHAYAPFERHVKYKSIVKLPVVESSTTIAVSFGFSSTSGEGLSQRNKSYIQLAFEYTSAENSGDSARISDVVTRLRVVTVHAKASTDPGVILKSADLNILFTHLTHQSIDEALTRTSTLTETRDLLQDWLLSMISGFHRILNPANDEEGEEEEGSFLEKLEIFLDEDNKTRSYSTQDDKATALINFTDFSALPQLQPLPRLVLALIRCPLFCGVEVPQDVRICLHYLYTRLAASEVVRGLMTNNLKPKPITLANEAKAYGETIGSV